MAAVEKAVRDLEQIQIALVRVHSILAQETMSMDDRHRIDRYFDAFASNLTGLEEYLRGMSAVKA